MDKFLIKGPTKLSGSIEISGSKNAALPIMVACIAYPGIYTLNNIPNLRDTKTIIKLMEVIGCKIDQHKNTLFMCSDLCCLVLKKQRFRFQVDVHGAQGL